MNMTSKLTTWGLMATLAAASLTPALADRASDQNNKNNMRNLAIAGAALGVYGLLNHNTTATVLGAAGAAVAGSQYEKDRQQQSQNNDYRYYDRNGRSYGRMYPNNNGSYNNSWNNNGYQNNGYQNNDYQNNDYQNNSRWHNRDHSR